MHTEPKSLGRLGDPGIAGVAGFGIGVCQVFIFPVRRGALDKGSNLYASATSKALIIQGFLRFWGSKNRALGTRLGISLPIRLGIASKTFTILPSVRAPPSPKSCPFRLDQPSRGGALR